MRKLFFCAAMAAFLISCNNKNEKSAGGDEKTTKAPSDLPYKANYSSSWSFDVSDADVKTVLQSYKDWENGDTANLNRSYGDSLYWDGTKGDTHWGPVGDVTKLWKAYRDSLSSVNISMDAWVKLFSTEKKDSVVITWYKEIDTYKDGKADSAYYHDINLLKKGKIVWLSQYKRPILPKK